jgi:hypothetical protein
MHGSVVTSKIALGAGMKSTKLKEEKLKQATQLLALHHLLKTNLEAPSIRHGVLPLSGFIFLSASIDPDFIQSRKSL